VRIRAGVERCTKELSYCFYNCHFFNLLKSAYLLKGNPQTEDKQWRLLMKNIRDCWELNLLWDSFTALSPSFPVCSSWMRASLCVKIAANSWRDALPPSSPSANRRVSIKFVKCGWERKKKRFSLFLGWHMDD